LIRTVARTGSTNADLALALSSGEYLAEGDWLIADRQDAGKGRLGRAWSDGAGNFMGSTVVRPGLGDPPAPTLALLAGLAVHEALQPFVPTGRDLTLKWPNDLLLDGAKVAGILLEMVAGVVVVGVGVNLAKAPEVEGRAVAALSDVIAPPDRDRFAVQLSTAFSLELERWRTAGLAPLLRRWQSAAHRAGTPLMVNAPGEEMVSGRFAGLSPEGSLLLTLADGTVRTINAGDVLLGTPQA